jgi:hypothetical protein
VWETVSESTTLLPSHHQRPLLTPRSHQPPRHRSCLPTFDSLFSIDKAGLSEGFFLYTSADERPRSSGHDSSEWYCPEPKYARNRQSTFHAKFHSPWPANSWPKSYGHSSANEPRESSDGDARTGTHVQSYCTSISHAVQPHGTATTSTAAPDDHPPRSELSSAQLWWKPPLRWPNASSTRSNAIWCKHHATSSRR